MPTVSSKMCTDLKNLFTFSDDAGLYFMIFSSFNAMHSNLLLPISLTDFIQNCHPSVLVLENKIVIHLCSFSRTKLSSIFARSQEQNCHPSLLVLKNKIVIHLCSFSRTKLSSIFARSQEQNCHPSLLVLKNKIVIHLCSFSRTKLSSIFARSQEQF